MEQIILDGNRLQIPKTAHPYLKEKLPFPLWYGNNLDALFECLCELCGEEIIIEEPQEPTAFYQKMLRVFRMAQAEGDFRLKTEGEKAEKPAISPQNKEL